MVQLQVPFTAIKCLGFHGMGKGDMGSRPHSANYLPQVDRCRISVDAFYHP